MCVCVCVCVCLYSSTVKASSVCKMSKKYLRVQINDLVLLILVDCVMPSSIIAVSENVTFHLQRRKPQPLSYWRENDDIKCITIVHDFQHVRMLFLLLVFFFCFILIKKNSFQVSFFFTIYGIYVFR